MSRFPASRVSAPPQVDRGEPRSLARQARAAGHELNNLLTTILGRSQQLLCQLEAGDVAGAELRRQLAEIESAARGGARTVERMMGAARAVDSTPLEPTPPESSRAMCIVVIDDEPPVRRLLSEILSSAGHEVLETSSPRQGLEWLDCKPVDLLLTDVGMPSVSGWEVARRARERRPELLIGVISGWGDQLSKRDLAEQGIDFLWSKPFNVKKILADLKEL